MKERLHVPPASEGSSWMHRWRGRLHPRHHHDELELNLVTQGTGRYLLDDRRYDLGPHSLVWLFPEQEHLLIDQSPDFAMWILIIRPAALRRHCRDERYRPLLAGNPAGHFCRRLADGDARRLRLVFDELETTRGDIARGNTGLAFATLTAWEMYRRAPHQLAGVRLHPAVERAASLLAGDDDADLAAIAARAGLSHSRLSHLFHEQTGQTLAAYRNRQRLERFFAAVGSGKGKTLLACALEAGFGSYAQFHRVFRRLTGASPAKWERNAEGG
jgi:AraC-like DNA-binding protein